MKFCKDCRHYVPVEKFTGLKPGDGYAMAMTPGAPERCAANPVSEELNRVTGGPKKLFVGSPYQNRYDESLCGQIAHWFEPIEEEKP
jgi:hypothetical protein